jgi:hypothetical protein
MKRFSANDNNKFSKELIVSDMLDTAVDWIKDNLNISDIYDENEIKIYVKENFSSIDDIFTDNEIIIHARNNFSINEIFNRNDIIEYIRDNFDRNEIFQDN